MPPKGSARFARILMLCVSVGRAERRGDRPSPRVVLQFYPNPIVHLAQVRLRNTLTSLTNIKKNKRKKRTWGPRKNVHGTMNATSAHALPEMLSISSHDRLRLECTNMITHRGENTGSNSRLDLSVWSTRLTRSRAYQTAHTSALLANGPFDFK